MIQSIIIYSGSFIFSILLAASYQQYTVINQNVVQTSRTKFNVSSIAYLLLVIFLPVFIGSVRIGIGTDYWGYLKIYQNTRGVSLPELFTTSKEPLYALLNYFVNLVSFNNDQAIFVFTTIIQISLITIALFYYKEKFSIAFGLFIYYTMFFLYGFNIIRQMLALSVTFFAFKYLLANKTKNYIITILFAAMFHYTALICLVFPLLDFKKNRYYNIKRVVYYSLVILSPLLIFPVIRISSYLPGFSYYLKDYSFSFDGYGLGFLAEVLPLVVILIYFRKQLLADKFKFDLFLNIALLCIPIRFLSYHIWWASRIVLYMTSTNMILVPTVLVLTKKQKGYHFYYFGFIAYYLLHFAYYFVYHNYGGTIPYTSIFN